MKKKLLIPILLIAIMTIGTVFGAFLTYKGFVEIYGVKYPLGQVEIETQPLRPIEGLEAREDYIGEIRVWTYSNNSELILQLMQLSHIVTNFRSFTVKVCLPLDVVYVVDLTGSMIPYMDDVKQKLIELTAALMLMNKDPVEIGVVGFKDFPAETTWLPLTGDYWEIRNYIEGLEAMTGANLPQSHYLGFEKAYELFHEKGDWLTHDKIVVFISDAEAGFADVAEFDHAEAAAKALAEEGVKIHSVLCGDNDVARQQLMWYSAISGGNFIPGPDRIVPGVTKDPTWIAKLTPITPFDSFRMKLASSPPTQKEGFYTYHIYVDFYCKAVPWHEWFLTELAAHLEKAELPPYMPPPPAPPVPPPPIGISLGIDPTKVYPPMDSTISWEIDPGTTTPVSVTLTLYEPDGTPHELYSGTVLSGSVTWSFDETSPMGIWNVVLLYDYEYDTSTGTMGAFGIIDVDP